MNVLETDKEQSGETLIERVPIKNSPFTAIGKAGTWFLVMGGFRLSEEKDTLEEILEMVGEEINWNVLLTAVGCMIEKYNQLEK